MSAELGESRQRRGSGPWLYEIRVQGRLGPTVLEAFSTLAAQHRGGDTLLRGVLPDQSALYGVLQQLEAFGIELLEMRRVPIA
jgi:hypothetical protein